MTTEYSVRSIRLKISVIGGNKENDIARLVKISDESYRAANEVVCGQYFNDELLQRLTQRLRLENEQDNVLKLVDEQFKDIFSVKRDATTERDIKYCYPELPSCVTNSLNRLVTSAYKKDKKEIIAGKRSLRTYKKGMPVPLVGKSVKFLVRENNFFLKVVLGRAEYLDFRIVLGKDKANNRSVLHNIVSHKIKYGIPLN